MTKSIEQRAKEYTCSNYSYIGDMYMDDGIKKVYTEAATEQRNIDIEKACDAYCKMCKFTDCGYLSLERCYGCLERENFNKAMKSSFS